MKVGMTVVMSAVELVVMMAVKKAAQRVGCWVCVKAAALVGWKAVPWAAETVAGTVEL